MLCWIMIIKHACASVSDMFKTIFTACTWLRMFHKCHIPVIPFFCLDSRDSYGGIHYTQRNSNMWLSSFFKPTNEEQLSMLGMKKQIWMSLNVELCYVFVRCCEVNTSRPVGSVERCSPVYHLGKRSLNSCKATICGTILNVFIYYDRSNSDFRLVMLRQEKCQMVAKFKRRT